jgi:adenosylcobyric acid synthase
MLGRTIVDPVESGRGAVDGLGRLPVDTTFHHRKVTRQRRGHSMGQHVAGYEIHHGAVAAPDGHGWVHLDDVHGAGDDGCVARDGSVLGVSLHGLFESDGFRSVFLTEIGRRRGKTFVPAGVSFVAAREARFDRLGDLIASHLDIEAIDALLAPVPAAP